MDHATVSYDPTLPNDPITKAYDAIQTNVSVKCAQCVKFKKLLTNTLCSRNFQNVKLRLNFVER